MSGAAGTDSESAHLALQGTIKEINDILSSKLVGVLNGQVQLKGQLDAISKKLDKLSWQHAGVLSAAGLQHLPPESEALQEVVDRKASLKFETPPNLPSPSSVPKVGSCLSPGITTLPVSDNVEKPPMKPLQLKSEVVLRNERRHVTAPAKSFTLAAHANGEAEAADGDKADASKPSLSEGGAEKPTLDHAATSTLQLRDSWGKKDRGEMPQPSGSPKRGWKSEGESSQDSPKSVSRSTTKRMNSSVGEALAAATNAGSLIKARNENSVSAKIWTFLEQPDSGHWASLYARAGDPVIVFSVGLGLVQTNKPPPISGILETVLEMTLDTLFLAEILLRYAVCPDSRAFLRSPYNVIDLIASGVSVVVRIGMFTFNWDDSDGTVAHYALLCLVPILRLLKILRRFHQFQLFFEGIRLIKDALKLVLFLLCIIVLFFSALIYIVEPRWNIDTLPQAMWLTIVTMTTVGYGDVTPETPWGHLVVSALVLFSVLYMALPIGIIGNAFTQVWQERDFILLTKNTRYRLVQMGYTAFDIVDLFSYFDTTDKGELNLGEFLEMMREMAIGLNEERSIEVFEALDKDGSGGIDAIEFVRAIFPHMYNEVRAACEEEAKEEDEDGCGDDDVPHFAADGDPTFGELGKESDEPTAPAVPLDPKDAVQAIKDRAKSARKARENLS